MYAMVCPLWAPIQFRTIKKYRNRRERLCKAMKVFLCMEHIPLPNLSL